LPEISQYRSWPKMSSYYAGSMKGSGIDSGDFEYGTYTCEYCSHQNLHALAYFDDWGNWSVACAKCEAVHAEGRLGERDED
jgi:hypothetical protein